MERAMPWPPSKRDAGSRGIYRPRRTSSWRTPPTCPSSPIRENSCNPWSRSLPETRFPEKPAVRRSFERAAATYDRHSVLQGEVGRRLLAHLEGIRIEPRRILDLGCGTGASFEPLLSRFTGPELVGIDIAHPMLLRA